MAYHIRMGVPEMAEFWNSMREKNKNGTASKDEQTTYKKIGKTLKLIAENPRHPGLQTHEIIALTKRYDGIKGWQSYLENHTPQAGRIFWVYGPNQSDITIIGVEPHPNDMGNAYKKDTLSDMESTSD